MLSKLTLDQLIPLPDEETVLTEITAQLTENGFPITNLKSGGVFYTLLRIFVRLYVELIQLCRTMLGNLYVSSADRVEWLEIRAADFSKTRKPALKTQGVLTLTRTESAFSAGIKKGCIFKTDPMSTGEELRYISRTDAVFEPNSTTCFVPVTAELAGSAYNLPPSKITRCLIHLEGVTGITNTQDWITREGSDIEGIESLRTRTLGAFADLAANPTRDKYKSACEAVPGVLYVGVDDQHPRGQGTVDIIVTSAAGEASDALLADVRKAADTIAGPYDNLLVKSSATVEQAVSVTLVLAESHSDDGIARRAEAAVRELFTIRRDRALNHLYISDLIVAVKGEIPSAKSVRVTCPAADLLLSTDQVIVCGAVSISIERG